MASVVNNGEETYWYEAIPVNSLKKQAGMDTGSENYWYEGVPVKELFPDESRGNFFLMMGDW